MKCEISVIIPVYNGCDTIRRCMESVLESTYQKFEIIILNDGSSDDSLEVIKEIQRQSLEVKLEGGPKLDPNQIRIFHHVNMGVGRTRNKGIDYSRGRYLVFVDQDDYVDPDYLELMHRQIKSRCADMVIGGYKQVREGVVVSRRIFRGTPWSCYMAMTPWARIYKRRFIVEKGIRFLDNDIGEDVYFNLLAIHQTKKIHVIQYCGYNWEINPHSVSHTFQKSVGGGAHVVRLLSESHRSLQLLNIRDNSYLEYFVIRYIVWYLIFVCRKTTAHEMKRISRELFTWLEAHYPDFLQNKNLSLFLPRGEFFRGKIAVAFIVFLYKRGLLMLFFRVYSMRGPQEI